MSLNTFDLARREQKFQPALGRPRCLTCANRSTGPVNSGYQCVKGGFFVTAWAVCNAYQVKAEPITPTYVDCGDCPAISTGCLAGNCAKACGRQP